MKSDLPLKSKSGMHWPSACRQLARLGIATAAVLALGGCDAVSSLFPAAPKETADSSADWEELKGLARIQLWGMAFDGDSHPVVSASGGAYRYTESDGWLPVGKLDDSTSIVQPPVQAKDGSVYMVEGNKGLYQLLKNAKSWVKLHTLGKYGGTVGPDGTVFTFEKGLYYQRLSDDAPIKSPLAVTDIPPQLLGAADGSVYFWDKEHGLIHVTPTTGAFETVFDCHSKELLQCRLPIAPNRFDGGGALYMLVTSNLDNINRIYKQSANGGTPVLVAELPKTLLYMRGTAVAPDGTFYVGGTRTNTLYGPVYRYAPGDTVGKYAFTPPGDIYCAPDGHIYAEDQADRVYRYKK
jgi:hypothetical protein